MLKILMDSCSPVGRAKRKCGWLGCLQESFDKVLYGVWAVEFPDLNRFLIGSHLDTFPYLHQIRIGLKGLLCSAPLLRLLHCFNHIQSLDRNLSCQPEPFRYNAVFQTVTSEWGQNHESS